MSCYENLNFPSIILGLESSVRGDEKKSHFLNYFYLDPKPKQLSALRLCWCRKNVARMFVSMTIIAVIDSANREELFKDF